MIDFFKLIIDKKSGLNTTTGFQIYLFDSIIKHAEAKKKVNLTHFFSVENIENQAIK